MTSTSAPASIPWSGGTKLFRCVSSLDELVEAWSLVYHNYRTSGLIRANAQRIHTVPQACQHRAMTAGIWHSRRIVATISAYPADGGYLPLDDVYRHELQELRSRGRQLLEIGLLAMDTSAQIAQEDRLSLMGAPMAMAMYEGLDVVIGVHPKHVSFYRRRYGFETLGEATTYASVGDAPVQLLHWDRRQVLASSRLPMGIAFAQQHFTRDFFDARFSHALERSASGSNPIADFLGDRFCEAV